MYGEIPSPPPPNPMYIYGFCCRTRTLTIILLISLIIMVEVDPAFIQAPDHRPKFKTSEPEGIPLIDLSNSNSNLVSQIGEACRKWGFFQVINHGVPLEFRARIEELARQFFALSLEEKKKVKRDEVNAMGYYDSEHTKNVRDWKEVFDFLLRDPTLVPASPEPQDKELRVLNNQWPHYPTEFREACQEYAREVEKLAFRLLEILSLGLGLPGDRFHGYFKDQISFLRLNYNPPCPCPELALGVGRHKDAGALTVLAQDDVGGLQVRNKSDGEWMSVKPMPNAYIINIGDVMQVWSNERYWSAEHRAVVNTQKERISIPFVFFPSHYVMVKPLEELVNEHDPPKYKEYNWGKYFVSRTRSDYQKQAVENIQVDYFKMGNH